MDVFSKRLLIAALSITMVLSGASLLVFTVSRAVAQNNGGSYQQAPGGERYGMATVLASSRTTGGGGGGRTGGGGGETINRYNILVWDTQTGASRIYFYDDNSASYMATLKQLPQQPLN